MSLSSELADLHCRAAADYAIVLIDTNGIVVSFNDSAQKLYNGSTEEMVRSLTAGRISRSVAEGAWIEESTTELLRADGSLAGFSRIARDASGVRKLEEQVLRCNEELHQFAFTVSHDLQESLRTARSYSELLSRRYKGQLDSDAGEFIDFIVDAVSRMSQLLKDLLAFSQAGRPDRTKPERAEASTVLQWTVMHLSKDISASGAKITHGSLPVVYADPSQLNSVFQHLIGNSIKFRSEAIPEIQINAKPTGSGLWEFAVKDNGVGIEPHQHERVFGIFKRLVGKNVPGTGVGLSISRKIVEAHGGKIWLESQPGQGTTVHFTLPEHA